MRIAKVFPRKTKASPDDELAFFGDPPDSLDVDQVHVSVTFSYDKEKAEQLAEKWLSITRTVKIGGPAYGHPGADFKPKRYLKEGYVITSRGCPNSCSFCDVPKREGPLRELSITEGWNLLDSNILACSDTHIQKVFEMLGRQKEPVQLSGGLEAARLTNRHVSWLWDLRPDQMFFAYDKTDDLEALVEAGKKLQYANFTRRHLRCFVLIGLPGDTFELAQSRLLQAWEAGFYPMAMLWKNKKGDTDKEWRKFSRVWARPPIFKAVIKKMYRELHVT